MSAQFNIRAANPEKVAHLQESLGLPRFIAATLVARGVDTAEEAEKFLAPTLEQDWLNPYIIPGISAVADEIESALKKNEHIMVYGDFDLDGISATTVLTRGLRVLGARVTPFIPLRFEEGYALTAAAFERAQKAKPDLIVTVDCGIACREEARAITQAGVRLCITDHHEPSDLVPDCVPVADPKLDPACESVILAGVGVALKLVQIVGGRFGHPHLWQELTDFAALGTVADLMPMRGENRALVSHGVARMNENPRPCIAALLASAGVADKPVTATNLSFSVIPRLNAAGRMGDAQLALSLLLCDDVAEAQHLAAQLEGVNNQRRTIEAELSEIAKAQAEESYHGQRALVVWGEGWHEGVKGIVASRLVNTYGVPSLLFTIEGNEARGSGRSVGQINLFKAVESVSDLLTRFGGHEAAVGLTLPAEKLPEFERRLCEYMDTLPEGAFHPLVRIDTCVNLGELTQDAVAQLGRLAPFGQEHPVPVYLASNVSLTNARAVGAEKNHFSCSLTNGSASVAGIMFHCSDIEALMHTDAVVNAAFEVQIDEWRGRKTVKAMLQSLSPAKTCRALEACMSPENRNFVAELYATSDSELCKDAPRCAEAVEAYEAALEKNRTYWEEKARTNPHELEADIVAALIDNRELHPAQRQILDKLREGKSLLGVMATGRGKSLTFQVHAALRALAFGETSVFVYPLRALIADQAFHLREALEPFGLSVIVLTGESTPEERRQAFAGLTDGTYDIALTTPEFLAWHAREFEATRRTRFVVVDEAHHIGTARAGQREAYANIGKSLANFNPLPAVLALTATADDDVADAIERELPLSACVFDSTGRPNLHIDDQRNLRNRDGYLASLVASGEKTIIYVNSREESIALARRLRKRVPQLAPLVGFYNAGLSRDERQRIEKMFRSDALSVLVATSAFGEGVDIPHIRHVVLYHVPYNEIEFNQMSGRAGRDGKEACVHVLFNRADAAINERILRDMTPDHDCLAQVYRELRARQKNHGSEFFVLSNTELAEAATNALFEVSSASAACGVAVFRELGLIETRTSSGPQGMSRSIRVNATQSKVELTDSVRYREGLGELNIFYAFRDWVLNASATDLQERISKPILPQKASQEGGLTL